ncbi:serine hydrolase domain-containing protein [Profundibacter amoris]|nr:serine hydrolase domain-containing protein [Profundibacter amoris]
MDDFSTSNDTDIEQIEAFEALISDATPIAERARYDTPLINRTALRVHGEAIIDNTFITPGPIFDRVRMVNEILTQMETAGAVGYSWAIVQNGQLVDAGGVGDARTASEENPKPMRARTKMVSASLAKPICAVTVMKLVEDGSLDLNQSAYPLIADAFPGGHSSLGDITIQHLLTHQSGFNGPGTLSAFPDSLAAPLSGTPGTGTRYENWNYWFLAHIVEAITGEPYVRVAQQTVLLPMGIHTMTRNVNEGRQCLYYAAGSSSDGRGWGDFTATAIGAYGWYANAVQWAKFLAHFRHDTVLSPATRRTMLEWSDSIFGFRLWHNSPRGTYYGHGGDFFTSGGRAFHGGIISFPDGIDAVLLTNSDDVANPESILMSAYHAAYI